MGSGISTWRAGTAWHDAAGGSASWMGRPCSFCTRAAVARCTHEIAAFVCHVHLRPAAGCGFYPKEPGGVPLAPYDVVTQT